MKQQVNGQNEVHHHRPGPHHRRYRLPTVETNTNTNADGSVSIKRIKKWQAKGGCKIDWASRCEAQCIGEGVQKGYKCGCENMYTDIWRSKYFPGWNICECACVL